MSSLMSDYHQCVFSSSAMLSRFSSIVGKVILHDEVSVFAGAHLRGDCEKIEVGSKTNIQENSTLHVSTCSPLVIGERVTVGHNAILHGATIEDDVLIGMGSTVMDGARVGQFSLVGAGALVTQGKVFEPRSLIVGSPAKTLRYLTDAEIEAMIIRPALSYVEVAKKMVKEGILTFPSPEDTIWLR